MKKILLFVAVLFSLQAKTLFAFGESPFVVEWPSDFAKLEAGKVITAEVKIHIPEGHYIYADKTEIEFTALDGLQIEDIRYPKVEKKADVFSGETVGIYKHDITIPVLIKADRQQSNGIHELAGVVHVQGCTPKLCLRPEERTFSWQIEVFGGTAAVAKQTPRAEQASGDTEKSFRSLLQVQNLNELTSRGWWFTLLIVFIAGMVTSFTPCVWPLIPVTLLVVGVKTEHSRKRNISLALSLVLGMVVMYALLGVAAVALGKSLGFLFQSKFFLGILVLFFVAMGLSLLGLFDIQVPAALMRKMEKFGGSGPRGAFMAGMATGLIASPCVGPVVGAILAYVSSQQSYLLGLLLLSVFGLGLGVFFFVLGLSGAALTRRLKGGLWMVWMKRALGVGVLLVAFGYALSLFGVRLSSATGEGPQWLYVEAEVLQIAQSSHRPIMIDFYADWCAPCHELDEKFFSREDIVELSNNFVMWRVDASNLSETLTTIEDKYDVIGYPSVKFLSPSGELLDEMTVTSFEPELLEQNMKAVLEKFK